MTICICVARLLRGNLGHGHRLLLSQPLKAFCNEASTPFGFEERPEQLQGSRTPEPWWPPIDFSSVHVLLPQDFSPFIHGFFPQRERRIHGFTLMFTIHYLNSRANGSLITPITFTYSLQSRE